MPASLRSPESEFTSLADNSTDAFSRPFASLLRAVAEKDQTKTRKARERCAAVIGQTMTLADLYGRRRVVLEWRFYRKDEPEAFASTPVVPNVPFSEAFGDLVSRTPELAANAQEVARLYNTRFSFALAKSAEIELTEAVQRFIGKALKEGKPAPKAATIIQQKGDWTRSYAQTVYRTNLTTAYTAGRFQQAQEPGVMAALPAMERWEVGDSATRRGRPKDNGENHMAIDGLILPTRHPDWTRFAPPAGYG